VEVVLEEPEYLEHEVKYLFIHGPRFDRAMPCLTVGVHDFFILL
jgi:hypothetical protein